MDRLPQARVAGEVLWCVRPAGHSEPACRSSSASHRPVARSADSTSRRACACAELVSASGSAQATVIFDVGCNKGYESASVFDHLAPSLGLNPASLYRHYQRSKVQLESLCGTCGNCHERAHVLLRPERSAVQVHCFEPGAVNYEVCRRLMMLSGAQ